jgi:type IV pilus assembly protein PilY1
VTAAAGNSFTATTCNTLTTGPTGVASCTAAAAAAGNSYTATTCNTVTTGPTPSASCTAAAASAGNSYTATTCNTVSTGPTGVSSCTPATAGSGNSYTATTCATLTTGPTGVASCTAASAASGNSYTATTCNTATTGPTAVASCSPASATAGNSYTATTCATTTTPAVGVATCTSAPATSGNSYVATNCATVNTGPTPVATCTPAVASSGNSFTATTCPAAVTTGPTYATTCTAAAASAGNSYTSTTCTPVTGSKVQYTTTTTVTTTNTSGGIVVGTPSAIATTGTPVDYDGACYISQAGPSLPSVPPSPRAQNQRPLTGDQPLPPSGCAAWPCTTTSGGTGGSLNSLADIAQYYYVNDLRPSMTDDVPATGQGPEDDRATWQHMTTFTIALGVSGTLNYRSDYKSASVITGDFADLRTGVKNWPVWPDPTLDYDNLTGLGGGILYSNSKSIDDFWHAAVNGRGQYFSAGSPTSVINGLSSALAGINSRLASAAAAATSNLEPVAGDNFAYTAKYTTSKWTGELEAHQINLTTGVVESAITWSAQAALDATASSACDNRNIYLFRSGASNNRVNFSWNTKVCDIAGLPTGAADTGLNSTEQGYFDSSYASLLSQYAAMTDGTFATADQRTPAAGANLVNFIRGQRGFEGFTTNDATKLYRTRDHILGDIVNAQPVYVKAPFASYTDADYTTFKNDNSSRTPMVYVAANDGMLHAFYAGTSLTDPLGGTEAWAFMPSMVLPNLYKLADNNYANTHTYFVDGTPTVGDAYDTGASAWKTMLVAGLNSGGKGYYALDITDPTTPKGLWEFKWSDTCFDSSSAATAALTGGADCHLGYTFGRPLISKLNDGTWVVLVTSGYNNVNSAAKAGDGEGYLYVLNAFTGKIIHKISTNTGDATTPSGLSHIINFVDNTVINNTTLRVYGVDVLGNIWRFDVNDILLPAGLEATLVGTAKDSGGTPQPITTRPELAEVNGNTMVFVATGRLLGSSDLTDTSVQSIYGLVDPLTATTAYSDLRGSLKPMAMTQVGTGASATRTIACTGSSAQCGGTSGWVVDLPDSGERVNVDIKLQLGTLIVGSNVPQSSACNIGGYSWLNYLNYSTGQAVANSPGNAVAQRLSSSLVVGLNIVRLPSGKTVVISTTSDAAQTTIGAPFDIPSPTGKRISWREITQ